MGCDIHVHIEVRIDGVWEHYAHPSVSRNYVLFAKMAGVRNYQKKIAPISKPKGVPSNMTKITRLDLEAWDTDAHSVSWFDLQDIMKLEEWLKEQDWGGVLKNDLEYGVLRTYLFGNSFSGLVKYPEDIRIPGLEDARFIFWFDN
jgi:hypothetical protein